MILILPWIVIIGFFRARHILLDIHRARRGLQQFFTCHGKERWGPPVKVKEWQRNAIHHLIAQRETLDNDIWQMKNRRNNLAEMEKEEENRLSELIISEINSKAGDEEDKSRFIEFEIARCRVKIGELQKRIHQKDMNIHSMELAKQLVNTCLKSYSRGKNPRLPVLKYIRGLFFDLR
jgi:hypothetical protein